MEKIAIISDIHANIVALETVLEDIEKRDIKRIFCLGDLVLKGSSPCEVVDIIKEKCEIVVKGNCDYGAVYPNGNKHKEWYHNILGKDRLEYLDSLPMYKDIYISGSHIKQYMQKLQNKTIINVGSVGNAVEFPNYDETITDMEETTQACSQCKGNNTKYNALR